MWESRGKKRRKGREIMRSWISNDYFLTVIYSIFLRPVWRESGSRKRAKRENEKSKSTREREIEREREREREREFWSLPLS